MCFRGHTHMYHFPDFFPSSSPFHRTRGAASQRSQGTGEARTHQVGRHLTCGHADAGHVVFGESSSPSCGYPYCFLGLWEKQWRNMHLKNWGWWVIREFCHMFWRRQQIPYHLAAHKLSVFQWSTPFSGKPPRCNRSMPRSNPWVHRRWNCQRAGVSMRHWRTDCLVPLWRMKPWEVPARCMIDATVFWKGELRNQWPDFC